MRARLLLLVSLLGTLLVTAAATVQAARQSVALFPPENLSDNAVTVDTGLLAQTLKEMLQDRFDVVPVPSEGREEPSARRRMARTVGASYMLTGAVSRIGRTVTLDLNIAPVEEPDKGKTVVVTGPAEDNVAPAGTLSPAWRALAISASAKVKYLFFGDEVVGVGGDRRKIPKLSGTITRSRNVNGEVVSVAWIDTDRDGKPELVAAYPESVAIYRVEGDDLAEKARIPGAGSGIVHVDAADINRNGVPEIYVTRFLAGKALSDVWEYDGKQYHRIASDLPYFLRTIDLGKEGTVLLGQESDPATIFKGAVFRIALDRYGMGETKERETPIPLPDGTWVYSFTALKKGGEILYAVLGERDRLLILGADGKRLWEGTDSVSGTETAVDPAGRGGRRLYLPNRIFALDLLGDGNDEVIVLNNQVSAGGFFENLRVFSAAEALCFAFDGSALQLAWRTAQLDGSARDAFVDFSPGTRALRIGVASRDKGKILGKFGEWRVLWLK